MASKVVLFRGIVNGEAIVAIPRVNNAGDLYIHSKYQLLSPVSDIFVIPVTFKANGTEQVLVNADDSWGPLGTKLLAIISEIERVEPGTEEFVKALDGIRGGDILTSVDILSTFTIIVIEAITETAYGERILPTRVLVWWDTKNKRWLQRLEKFKNETITEYKDLASAINDGAKALQHETGRRKGKVSQYLPPHNRLTPTENELRELLRNPKPVFRLEIAGLCEIDIETLRES